MIFNLLFFPSLRAFFPFSPMLLPFLSLLFINSNQYHQMTSYVSLTPQSHRYNSVRVEFTFNPSPIEHPPVSPILLSFLSLLLFNSYKYHPIESYISLTPQSQPQFCESWIHLQSFPNWTSSWISYLVIISLIIII